MNPPRNDIAPLAQYQLNQDALLQRSRADRQTLGGSAGCGVCAVAVKQGGV